MAFGVSVRAEAGALKARVEATTFDWGGGTVLRVRAYLEECTGGDSFLFSGPPDEVARAIEALVAAYRQWEEAGRPAPVYVPTS